MKKISVSRRFFLAGAYAILVIAALLCVLPFINLLAISFSDKTAVAAGRVTFLPIQTTTASYRYLISDHQFLRSFGTSLLRVIIGVSVQLLIMLPAAFSLSHSKDQLFGRSFYAVYFVITMIVSGGMIPSYLVVAKLGLIGSFWSMILPMAVPVYNMIILMNFMRSLPKELEEAAMIDGATPMKTLISVVIPISKAGIATVMLFCIISHWNSWFDGMIYLDSVSQYPLQSYLYAQLRSIDRMMREMETNYEALAKLVNMRTTRAAMMFIGALPMLIVYPFLQKYFTKGLVLGSVKG
ncbi:MAG: carbohydrate ABC transporter permease [Clostridia bacterium]|nr:carbohydrate ABC transporter permease [Clostridia bacterium]